MVMLSPTKVQSPIVLLEETWLQYILVYIMRRVLPIFLLSILSHSSAEKNVSFIYIVRQYRRFVFFIENFIKQIIDVPK